MLDLGEWLCATYGLKSLMDGLCWPLAHAWLAYRAHKERTEGKDALGPDLGMLDLVAQIEADPRFANM